MNDATNVMMDAMATALYNNSTNTQQFIGLARCRWRLWHLWQHRPLRLTPGGSPSPTAGGSVNPTRQNILQYISGTVKNGAEMPSFGVCGFGTWTLLAQDFVGHRAIRHHPRFMVPMATQHALRAAFRALMVAGVPIYPDPYCPEGTVYFLNTNYLSLYIHEQGSFVFTRLRDPHSRTGRLVMSVLC